MVCSRRFKDRECYDPDRLHHLRDQLEFPGGLQTAAEITFSGVYGDSVSSELTAIPVSITGVGEPAPIEDRASEPLLHGSRA